MKRQDSRANDVERALSAPIGDRFTAADLEGLPPRCARYFSAAITSGMPKIEAARLHMRGQIKVGRWLPFTAVEVLDPHRGFVWSARVAGGLITGSDRYLGRDGAMRWKVLGTVPVMKAAGSDVTRSAAARAGAEGIWLPTAMLPSTGAAWRDEGDRSIAVRFAVDDTALDIRHTLGDDDRIRSTAFNRWGDPERDGNWGWFPAGGDVSDHRTFDGLTIPSSGSFGWHYGTDRWGEGEFFRYEITALEPLLPSERPER